MPLVFTLFQVAWSIAWGTLHVRIRRGRRYARGRAASGVRDGWYRRLNPLFFVAQLALSVACFWSDADVLLELHDSAAVRLLGAAMLSVALALTHTALAHLGRHYAPCYDAHVPRQLVRSGPYSLIRHPMYAAKLVAGVGALLLSGSLWLAPSTVYLFVVTWRALRNEEAELRVHLEGYEQYSARTTKLIPYVF